MADHVGNLVLVSRSFSPFRQRLTIPVLKSDSLIFLVSSGMTTGQSVFA